jgi:hypothetical protein
LGAVGDGVADDTLAIAAAMNAVRASRANPVGPKTVFFPSGVFRVTSTLHMNYTSGMMLLGCGRATTLLWDGPPNAGDASRLFWSDGNTRSHMEGFVIDGRGVPGSVGVDHDSHGTLFETRLVHRHILFVNWTVAGFRVGHSQLVPGGIESAEMTFENCAFWRNPGAGLQILEWNDYDNYFTGCAFVNNTVSTPAVRVLR